MKVIIVVFWYGTHIHEELSFNQCNWLAGLYLDKSYCCQNHITR